MGSLFKKPKVPKMPAVPSREDPDIQAAARAERVRNRLLSGLAGTNLTGGATLGDPEVLSNQLGGY